MRGKIIEFEGMDGCFKETNSKRLTDYLNDQGIRTTRISFPSYNSSSNHINYVESFLNDQYKGNLTKRQIALLFAMDRFDQFQYLGVEERLKNGEWFVIDRYTESNIIYQAFDNDGIFNKDTADFIHNFEHKELGLPEADIILAMYPSDMNYIINNIINKRYYTDKFESSNQYLLDVYSNFEELINRNLDWNVINVLKPIDQYTQCNEISNDPEDVTFRTEDEIFNSILDTLYTKGIITRFNKIDVKDDYNIMLKQLIQSANLLIEHNHIVIDTVDRAYSNIQHDTVDYCKKLLVNVAKLTMRSDEKAAFNQVHRFLDAF